MVSNNHTPSSKMSYLNCLPSTEETCEDAQVIEIHPKYSGITDDQLARILHLCPNLQRLSLAGVRDLSDRSLVIIAQTTTDLKYIDISGCKEVTDIGVHELASQANRLEVVKLNGIVGLTDPSLIALVRSLPRLAELDATDLPLLTSHSVRDIWTFGQNLKKVRLGRCGHIDDKGFPIRTDTPLSPVPSVTNSAAHAAVIPSPVGRGQASSASLSNIGSEGGLYHAPDPEAGRISSWLDALPPLILPGHRVLSQLRTLDLTECTHITDSAVAGIVAYTPHLQHIHLAGCVLLTNASLSQLTLLGRHLETLTISYASTITDAAILDLVRACPNLAVIDVSYCTLLSDLSVLELAILPHLRHLSIAGLPLMTDISLLFLAEHGVHVSHLQLAHCRGIALNTIHILIRRLQHLNYLSTTGVRSMTRTGIWRFSEKPPSKYDSHTAGAYRVFRGSNIAALRQFLDKEELRRREAENKNIPFVPRGDDSMDLY
ncbi:RNI-like protein [Trametopsis cervina]|nr:RNI-like protein [Trametopsis cervina]